MDDVKKPGPIPAVNPLQPGAKDIASASVKTGTPSKDQSTMATNYDFNRAGDEAKANVNHAADAARKGGEDMMKHGENAVKHGQDALRQGGEQAIKQGQDVMRQGQAVLAQVADRTRETMDRGAKAFEEFSAHSRGSVDAFSSASRAAAQGVEQMVQQAAEFSRKSIEGATATLRTLASAKSPNEVFQAQNDFVKAQFDNFVGEYSKLTETMMRVTGEVFEPITSRMNETAAKAGESMRAMTDKR